MSKRERNQLMKALALQVRANEYMAYAMRVHTMQGGTK